MEHKQPMTDTQYLKLLETAEPALKQLENACEATSQSLRLQSIVHRLNKMGVRDIELCRDDEIWNSMLKEQRAKAVAEVFEAYLDGEYSPMGKLND